MNEIPTTEQNPLALLGQMDLKSIDPEQVGKLMDLQSKWEDRQASKAFNAALHQFQADCPQIHKGSKAHNSSYAKFEDLQKAIKPHMAAHGFSESFDTETNEQGAICAVICTLSHIAGHSATSRFPVMPDTSGSKNGIQAIGSALSYGKRYSLSSILGLVFTDEDDDGEAAAAPETVTQAQGDEIAGLATQAEELSQGSRQRFLDYAGVKSFYDIPADKAEHAIDLLNRKIDDLIKKGGAA